MVKYYRDGGLQRGQLNDPLRDAQLAREVFHDQYQARDTLVLRLVGASCGGREEYFARDGIHRLRAGNPSGIGIRQSPKVFRARELHFAIRKQDHKRLFCLNKKCILCLI